MRKGDQTRQSIIRQTAEVFNMYGFAGTSMSALVRATGLEKGGIYNHFPSKEALALAAFDYAVEQITERFRDAIGSSEHAVDRLLAIIAAFHDYAIDPPIAGGCPVLNTAIEADDAHPALRQRAQAAMESWLRLVGGTAKAGVARGELSPDADPRALASVIVGMLEGALMLTKLYDDPSHMERAVAHLTQHIRSLKRD